MKKFLLIVIAACSLAACKKNGVSPPINIVGKWELHERRGGNIIPQDTVYKTGNGNMLQFNSDSTYVQYQNGAISLEGTYHITKTTGINKTMYTMLIFSNDSSFQFAITLSGTLLSLSPLMPDIGTEIYQKI